MTKTTPMITPAGQVTSSQIGPMLRKSRKERNLTLEVVAKRSGIAVGFLSEIERDQASPSVATLIRLCDVLGIPVGSLFQTSQAVLVRAGQGERMRYGGTAISYELMTSRAASKMAAIRAEVQPGGQSGPELHTLQADEEFVLVLEGTLRMHLEGETFDLAPGDALTFDPRRPHRYLNPSATDVCRCICLITPQPR